MHVALISNHRSGSSPSAEDLERRLRALGAEVTSIDLRHVDAVGRPHDPVPDRRMIDRVVAAGGDGTVASCARLAGRLGRPFALIPAGTANDFARTHGLPTHLDAACRLAVRGRHTEGLEIGFLPDDRPFVNVASAGLATTAARLAQPYKKRLGPLAYVAGAAHAGFAARPLHVELVLDGKPFFAEDAWQVIVSVSGAFGGGSSVDAADASDGMLHVTVMPARSRRHLIRHAWAMRRGSIADQHDVRDGTAREVTLTLPTGEPLNVDGEIIPAPDGTMRAVRDGFRLVVPSPGD